MKRNHLHHRRKLWVCFLSNVLFVKNVNTIVEFIFNTFFRQLLQIIAKIVNCVSTKSCSVHEQARYVQGSHLATSDDQLAVSRVPK